MNARKVKHTIKSLIAGTVMAAYMSVAVMVWDVVLYVYLEVPLR